MVLANGFWVAFYFHAEGREAQRRNLSCWLKGMFFHAEGREAQRKNFRFSLLLTKMHDLSLVENQISQEVVDACIRIHTALGPGLFEKVYEEALLIELSTKRQFSLERQHPIQAYYEGHALGESFYADLIIEQKVILEIKSVEKLLPVHFKQLLTYLRLTGLKLGLLINFRNARKITSLIRLEISS